MTEEGSAMQVEAIQLGVYTFGGANLGLGIVAALSTLLGSHRSLDLTFTMWAWLWKLIGVYAVLAILAVVIPSSIDPLPPTTETLLSIACLTATVPTWWVLHRWRQRRRAQRAAAHDAVKEATTMTEHAARVRRTSWVDID